MQHKSTQAQQGSKYFVDFTFNDVKRK